MPSPALRRAIGDTALRKLGAGYETKTICGARLTILHTAKDTETIATVASVHIRPFAGGWKIQLSIAAHAMTSNDEEILAVTAMINSKDAVAWTYTVRTERGKLQCHEVQGVEF